MEIGIQERVGNGWDGRGDWVGKELSEAGPDNCALPCFLASQSPSLTD